MASEHLVPSRGDAGGLAADLADLCRRFDADPAAGDTTVPLVSQFLETGPQFPFAQELAALLERTPQA